MKNFIITIIITIFFTACVRTDLDIERDVAVKIHPLAPDCTMYVKNGVVFLAGVVKSDKKRDSTEAAAKAISGVKSVVNKLHVVPPPDKLLQRGK